MKNSKYLIDSHVHISRAEPTLFSMPEPMVIEAMERYEIDFCCVSNIDGSECGHDQSILPSEYQNDQVVTLKNDIAFAKRYEGKIGILPFVSPLLQGYSKEFEQLVLENKKYIYGIKLHPYHNRTAPDSKRFRPYLELADRLNIPVLSHTGGCEEASISHICNAAEQFKSVPFIMAHMGLGSNNQEALEALGKYDNLYVDTAWVSVSTILEVIKRYGSHRVLFGTDMPIDGVDTYLHNKNGDRSLYQEYFYEFHEMISQADYDNVMYKTAMDLYKIKLDIE